MKIPCGKGKWRAFVALLLCASILTMGPLEPLHVYANLDFSSLEGGDDGAAEEAAQEEQQPKQATEEKPARQSNTMTEEQRLQQEIEKLNNQINSLKEEEEAIRTGLNATQSEKEKALREKEALEQQIVIKQSKISSLEESITLQEESIVLKELQIEDKQAEIDENYAKFKMRLRAMYVNDDTTTLGLILGADDFADFLNRTEIVVRIAEYDRNLMETLTQQREELEAIRDDLEQKQAQLASSKQEIEEEKQVLSVQQSAVAAAVYSLEQLEQEFQADLEKNQQMTAAMQSEINNIYRQIELSKNPYVGGEMAWPVPGFYTISSPYGYRFSGTDFHTGMDIAGGGRNIYGQAIVAANAGTVKFVNWNYTPGVGYGRYLIIDHGGQTSTLYAHCSNIVVSVGDEVQKGQKIAEVGSTGWSTGPHLHFEVRIGAEGKHTNPYPYVAGGAS